MTHVTSRDNQHLAFTQYNHLPRKAHTMSITLTTEQAEVIRDIAHNEGLRFDSYSGRGMYGTECLSIVASRDMDFLAKFIFALTQEDEGLAEKFTYGIHSDSMGYDTVIYWPGITPIASDDDDDDDL